MRKLVICVAAFTGETKRLSRARLVQPHHPHSHIFLASLRILLPTASRAQIPQDCIVHGCVIYYLLGIHGVLGPQRSVSLPHVSKTVARPTHSAQLVFHDICHALLLFHSIHAEIHNPTAERMINFGIQLGVTRNHVCRHLSENFYRVRQLDGVF